MSEEVPIDEYHEGGFPENEPTPAAATGARKPMGFLEHLEDLRMTLVKSAVVFGGFVTLIAYWVDDFAKVLSWPLERVKHDYPQMSTELITNSPMGVF